MKKKEAKALAEAGSGENFGNGETEEKYQCLRCNATEDECGRSKQKKDTMSKLKKKK